MHSSREADRNFEINGVRVIDFMLLTAILN